MSPAELIAAGRRAAVWLAGRRPVRPVRPPRRIWFVLAWAVWFVLALWGPFTAVAAAGIAAAFVTVTGMA